MDDKQRQRERQIAAGQWLRTTRERKGFSTLNQFAQELGIDPSQLSRYELGTSAISNERAERIAAVLGLSIIETRRGLQLWVPDEDAPAREDAPTDEELRASGLAPETVEALLDMRRHVGRLVAKRDEDAIRRANRVLRALDEGQDAG